MMIHPPATKSLPYGLLAACFKYKVSSYKFYWLLAVIEGCEQGERRLEKLTLFARMIALAWYPYNYFQLNFGPQDKLGRTISLLIDQEEISVDAAKSFIVETLQKSRNADSIQQLQRLDEEVPHRFLSPWYPGMGEHWKKVYNASQRGEGHPPYSLFDKHIEVDPEWARYFRENSGILKSFVLWHLAQYLQQHNPSVPDLIGKLTKPAKRKPLHQQRRAFWDIIIDEQPITNCIYTQLPLEKDNYAVEHFLPYAFLTHDLIWNLIPAERSFNSSKSDRLPSLERYFEAYLTQQVQAINIVRRIQPHNPFLRQYLSIMPQMGLRLQMDLDYCRPFFRDTVFPLHAIATANGFLGM